jgi:hypothetical protein
MYSIVPPRLRLAHWLHERTSIDQGPSQIVLTPRLLTTWGVKFILTKMKAGRIYLSPDWYKSYGWLDTSTRAVAVQTHLSQPDAVAAYLLSAQRTAVTTLCDDSPFNRDPYGSFETVMKRYEAVVRFFEIEPKSITL